MDLDFSATNIIIGITCIISFVAMNNQKYLYDWAMVPSAIKQRKEYYRFMLSGFIHASFFHLLFNMITLYSFGALIESVFVEVFGGKFGMMSYFIFYLIAIVVSDLPTYFKNQNKSNYMSLGASGAVSAVIFAAILFVPTSTLLIFFIPMPAFIFGALYLIYTTYENNRSNPLAAGINHSAHLWGAIFGIVSMAFLYPQVFPHFINQIMNWKPLSGLF
jgi:membrane associated rhomboid family serine protease